MDFGLAFMTPRPQTVNLACKQKCHRMSSVHANTDRGFKSYFVIFCEFFGNVFEFVDKAQIKVHSQTKGAYLGCKAVEKTSIIRTDS